MRSITTLVAFITATLGLSAQLWQPVIPNRAVFGLAVNPQNTRTVLAGNMARTMFRSTDGGTTWEELSIRSPGGSSQITCVVIHPVDTNVIIAGGIGFDGLDRSTDGGVTWTNVHKDPTGFRMEYVGESVAWHPTAPDTMYAIRNTPGIVYRSTDRGATWDSLSTIPTARSTDRFRAISVAPDSTNIVLVGGRYASPYRSTDGGRTFTAMAMFTGHPDTDIGVFRWSPTTPGMVYASVQFSRLDNPSNGGLFRSTDWGATWARLAHADTSIFALEVQPGVNGLDEIFVGGNQPPLTPAIMKGDSVVLRSTDGGARWERIDDVAWTENELAEVSANVWAFRIIQQPGGPQILMASEGGAFLSNAVTSVDADAVTSPLSIRRSRDGSLHLAMEGVDGPATVDIVALDGSTVSSRQVNFLQGTARVAPSPLANGAYVVVVRTATTRRSGLMLHH